MSGGMGDRGAKKVVDRRPAAEAGSLDQATGPKAYTAEFEAVQKLGEAFGFPRYRIEMLDYKVARAGKISVLDLRGHLLTKERAQALVEMGQHGLTRVILSHTAVDRAPKSIKDALSEAGISIEGTGRPRRKHGPGHSH